MAEYEQLFSRLPYLVQPDNVVRYQDNTVWILDRRIYPFKKEFVICRTYEEVAKAIYQMVTQSSGPIYAVAYGMALAAHSIKRKSASEQIETMSVAAKVLGEARPTNNLIKYQADRMLDTAIESIHAGTDTEAVMLDATRELIDSNYRRSSKLGQYAAELIKDGYTILNHCWAEAAIVYTLLHALDQGKKVSAICSETRPYLQGSRLTANAISEMGIPTTVICDNMPGRAMQLGKVNCFFSGTDRVTLSGHVINKVGTFQAALSAHYYGIPYYALCYEPDKNAHTDKNVVIEDRDPDETLFCLGNRVATDGVTGYYPAFDVTPPTLVNSIVTPKGLYTPYTIKNYFDA